jgi:hypothetical protein
MDDLKWTLFWAENLAVAAKWALFGSCAAIAWVITRRALKWFGLDD